MKAVNIHKVGWVVFSFLFLSACSEDKNYPYETSASSTVVISVEVGNEGKYEALFHLDNGGVLISPVLVMKQGNHSFGLIYESKTDSFIIKGPDESAREAKPGHVFIAETGILKDAGKVSIGSSQDDIVNYLSKMNLREN
jgi:hypothetical protein